MQKQHRSNSGDWRDPKLVEKLIAKIHRSASRCWTVMEVCGGQTHSILRYGLDQRLSSVIEWIHGPGCPVCVTDASWVDLAITLSFKSGTIVCTFGDMMRVPGAGDAPARTLMDARALGAQVMPVLSPAAALDYARQHPDQEVVFFSVGFETTVPATALAALAAHCEHISNFFLLVSHVRVPPAVQALLEEPDHRIQGLLAAGHVCTVMGVQEYQPIVAHYQVPVVVTGFEPVDVLLGVLSVVHQLEKGEACLDNQYARYVNQSGNLQARQLVEKVYHISDQYWRGLGLMKQGGLTLKPPFDRLDARSIDISDQSVKDPGLTACGQSTESICQAHAVLTGKMKPNQCPHFGTICQPSSALGPPMVSDEGACAAYYHARVGMIESS